jgi:hypothetical protein
MTGGAAMSLYPAMRFAMPDAKILVATNPQVTNRPNRNNATLD